MTVKKQLKGTLTFLESSGRLQFSYLERRRSSSGIIEPVKIRGTIPKRVQIQGNKAIKAFVIDKIRREFPTLEEKKRRKQEEKHIREEDKKKRIEFENNPNYPIEVLYRRIVLKGKITFANGRQMDIQLDDPYQGEDFVLYGWASGVLGRHMFDSKGDFTENAIETAQQRLIWIYQKEKRKDNQRKLKEKARELNTGND